MPKVRRGRRDRSIASSSAPADARPHPLRRRHDRPARAGRASEVLSRSLVSRACRATRPGACARARRRSPLERCSAGRRQTVDGHGRRRICRSGRAARRDQRKISATARAASCTHRAASRSCSASAIRSADLMFVGEAPGADEDVQGEPFVGRAGQLLTKIIESIGLQRSDVYIANVIKCRPPQNRNPEPDEVATCQPFLFQQIDAIQPRVIVALGTFAAQTLLNTVVPISRLRGRVHDFRGGAKLIPDVPSRLSPAQSRSQTRRVGRHEESA